MNNEFLSALGLCKKAGFVKFGFDTVKSVAQSGEAVLVFSASDISAKTLKELSFVCEQTGTEHIKTGCDMNTLGGSIGKATGIIAVTDEGFAKMLRSKLEGHKEDNL